MPSVQITWQVPLNVQAYNYILKHLPQATRTLCVGEATMTLHTCGKKRLVRFSGQCSTDPKHLIDSIYTTIADTMESAIPHFRMPPAILEAIHNGSATLIELVLVGSSSVRAGKLFLKGVHALWSGPMPARRHAVSKQPKIQSTLVVSTTGKPTVCLTVVVGKVRHISWSLTLSLADKSLVQRLHLARFHIRLQWDTVGDLVASIDKAGGVNVWADRLLGKRRDTMLIGTPPKRFEREDLVALAKHHNVGKWVGGKCPPKRLMDACLMAGLDTSIPFEKYVDALDGNLR